MRRKRPLDRRANPVRDASLIVIASEDRHAVRQYFDFFAATRIQFKVLETEDGKSAPEHVLSRLDEYATEFEIGEGDILWLVCDCDHWVRPNHIQNLTQVLQLCRQKGYRVALSNPCFDLWLLLHFSDMPEGALTCPEVAARLRSSAGGYDKTKVYKLPIDDARVSAAVGRAAGAHKPSQEIPVGLQTGVHLIIQELVQRQIITVPTAPAAAGRPGRSARRRPRPTAGGASEISRGRAAGS